MLIHLIPEEFASLRSISIIEAIEISLADPVADSVLICLCIHPSLLVELLVVLCLHIEFRPNGNHHAAIQIMDRVYHCLRIRETFRIELVSTPVILSPMAPVHHDIIDRNIPLTETLESLDHLGRCLVALTALPVSHSPFRHDRSLSCQCPVSADDLVHILTGYEIPVHLLCHLAPPLMLSLLCRINDIINAESAVRHPAVRLPLHLYRSLDASLEMNCELVCIRIPRRTPPFRNDGLAAHLD